MNSSLKNLQSSPKFLENNIIQDNQVSTLKSLNRKKTKTNELEKPFLTYEYLKSSENPSENTSFITSNKLLIAQNHFKANRIKQHKYLKTSKESFNEEICQCCQLRINGDNLPLCCKRSDIYYLGPTINIFFQYLLASSLIILIVLLPIQSMISLLYYSHNDNISSLWYDFPLVYNNDTQIINAGEFITNTGLIILLCIIVQVYRYHIRKLKIFTHKSLVTPADYSIMVKFTNRCGLKNHNTVNIYELKNFFENYAVPYKTFNIAKITLVYDLKLFVEKMRNSISKSPSNNNIENDDSKIENDDTVISSRKIFNSHDLFTNFESHKTNLVIISFTHIKEAKKIRKKFRMNLLEQLFIRITGYKKGSIYYFFNRNIISVEKAPEINDIIWENGLATNFFSKIRSYFLIIMFQACLLAIFYYIQQYLISNCINKCVVYMSIPPYILLSEPILNYLITKITKTENYFTVSAYQLTIIKRMTIFFILNIIGITIILQISNNNLVDQLYFKTTALITLVTLMISPIVSHIFDFSFYLQKLIRMRIISKKDDAIEYTQDELNQLFTNPIMPIEYNYSKAYQLTILGVLIIPLNFMSGFITIFGVLLFYTVEKYALLRKYSLSPNYSLDIGITSLYIAELWPFILATGQLLNLYLSYLIEVDNVTDSQDQNYKFTIYIALQLSLVCLSLINVISPWKKLNKIMFKNQSDVVEIDVIKSTHSYTDASKGFKADYDTDNPIKSDLRQDCIINTIGDYNSESINNISIDKNYLPEITENKSSLLLSGIVEYLAKFKNKKDIFSRSRYEFPLIYGYGLASYTSDYKFPFGISLLVPMGDEENISTKTKHKSPSANYQLKKEIIPQIQVSSNENDKGDNILKETGTYTPDYGMEIKSININSKFANISPISGVFSPNNNIEDQSLPENREFSKAQTPRPIINTLNFDDNKLTERNFNFLLSVENTSKMNLIQNNIW